MIWRHLIVGIPCCVWWDLDDRLHGRRTYGLVQTIRYCWGDYTLGMSLYNRVKRYERTNARQMKAWRKQRKEKR